MGYVVPPPPVVSIPVAGGDDRFPVRRIICVGRNYADHAKELGNAVPTEPLLFLKAPSAIIYDGSPIVIPPQSDQVEHEGARAQADGHHIAARLPPPTGELVE